MAELKGLRDDVYRRPLATALERLAIGPGWRCVDVGAGGGDVSVALAEVVGHTGRVYSVDYDPLARDEVLRGITPDPRHPAGFHDDVHLGVERPRRVDGANTAKDEGLGHGWSGRRLYRACARASTVH